MPISAYTLEHRLQIGTSLDILKKDLDQTKIFFPLILVLICSAILIVTLNSLRNEKLLAESENKYRSLVENASECITVVQDSRYVFANSQTGRFLGVNLRELIGKRVSDYAHPDDRKG